jgi:XTP/dITP diphosphohydrolase
MEPLGRILVATGNAGKLAELRELLAFAGIEAVSPRDVGWTEDGPETGETLEDNALAKARAGLRATGLTTLADDSGLFVDALDGAPGVRSARFAGEAQDPAANCRKLLRALEGVPPERRGAEFRCVLALVRPDGTERVFRGTCRGTIQSGVRGTGGFGYDPLFIASGAQSTFAEMDAADKHRLSHRGRALSAFRRALAGMLRADETTTLG